MRTTYRDIKNDIMNGKSMTLLLIDLDKIKSIYAKEIADSFRNLKIKQGMALLNASIRFEITMELKNESYMTKSGFKGRVDNLISIKGMTKKKAIRLTNKRNKTMSSQKKEATYTIENGLCK